MFLNCLQSFYKVASFIFKCIQWNASTAPNEWYSLYADTSTLHADTVSLYADTLISTFSKISNQWKHKLNVIESTDSANLRTCSTCSPPFIRRIGCFFCVTPWLTDLRTVTCLVWIILKWMIKSVNEHITIFPWWLIGYEATVHWIKINRWLFSCYARFLHTRTNAAHHLVGILYYCNEPSLVYFSQMPVHMITCHLLFFCPCVNYSIF